MVAIRISSRLHPRDDGGSVLLQSRERTPARTTKFRAQQNIHVAGKRHIGKSSDPVELSQA
jgi:hypothetical protein